MLADLGQRILDKQESEGSGARVIDRLASDLREAFPALFCHLKLRRYIAIELKARKFQPGDGAQLGMYMTAVDRLLAHPDDKPTLGLLLVREKNRVLVEYALGGNSSPISVAEWETQLTRSLPQELRGSLPTIEELEAELERDCNAVG